MPAGEALPHLLTFVEQGDRIRHDLAGVLAPDWQALRWTSQDMLAAIPAGWRSVVRVLLAT